MVEVLRVLAGLLVALADVVDDAIDPHLQRYRPSGDPAREATTKGFDGTVARSTLVGCGSMALSGIAPHNPGSRVRARPPYNQRLTR